MDDLTPPLTLAAAVAARRRQPQPRVFALDHQGHRLWVKQAAPLRRKFWNRLHRSLARLLPVSFFLPMEEPGGAEALKAEAYRLLGLSRGSLPVPNIVAMGSDWLALGDCGPSLIEILPRLSSADQARLLQEAAQALADFHQAGQAHGHALLRNMTWNQNKIYFIDFEAQLPTRLPLAQAQARDGLLFAYSLADSPDPAAAARALAQWRRHAPSSAVQSFDHGLAFALALAPLLRLFAPWGGRDLRRILRACELARRLRHIDP